MFKNTVLIVIFTCTLITPNDSKAHLDGYVYIGFWWHMSSLMCQQGVRLNGDGGGLGKHGGLLKCSAEINEVEFQCASPVGKLVKAEWPRNQSVTVASESEFDEPVSRDKKNKATPDVYLDTNLAIDPIAKCHQNKYTVVLPYLIRAFTGTILIYKCLDSDCNQKQLTYTDIRNCRLSDDYSLGANHPNDFTEFDCGIEYIKHES